MASAPNNSYTTAGQITIPTTETPFVDANLRITQPWHRLLVNLWKKLGSGQSSLASTAYLVQNTVTGLVDVYSSVTNAKLGSIQFQPATGGPPEPQIVGASPSEFLFTKFGYVAVASGKVELARGTSAFYQLSLVGGYFPVEPGDTLRISWFDAANPPSVTLFPYSP